MPSLQAGKTAPDFTLPDQHGREVSLSHYRGKSWVVLYFYPADNTPICTREACQFRDAHTAFTDLDAVILGVSSNAAAEHAAFAAHYGLPFVLLSDAEGAARKLYGVPRALGFFPGRSTYLIDPDGTIRHVTHGAFQAQRHVRETLDALRAIRSQAPA